MRTVNSADRAQKSVMAEVVFYATVPSSDPSDTPVTILGKKANLKKVPFSDVSPYLAPRVSPEVGREVLI